jgi:hypothetical protein
VAAGVDVFCSDAEGAHVEEPAVPVHAAAAQGVGGFGARSDQTCYQSNQSDEGLKINLSEAILRPNLIDLFAKTRVVKSDLIDLDKIELSEFKLT